LLKKLRAKKHEEEENEEKEIKERAKSEEKRTENIKTLNLGAIKDENSGKVTYIDPLDFFKTEHPIEVDKNLDEFGLNDVKEEKKENVQEKEKEKEKEKKPKLKAVIGAVNMKIKFEDMMKARNKIKNDDKAQNKKSLSVGTRNVKNDKNKFEIINKTKEDRDQRLYIKLILARNKFNKTNINQQDIYLDIQKKLAKLKEFPDKTGDLQKEINENPNCDRSLALRGILASINVLVDGPYIEELRDIAHCPFRGSTNQRLIYLNNGKREDK
jgi:hypothetical protein